MVRDVVFKDLSLKFLLLATIRDKVQNQKGQVSDPLIAEIRRIAKNPQGIKGEQKLTFSPVETEVGEMSSLTAHSTNRNCVWEYSRDILIKGGE